MTLRTEIEDQFDDLSALNVQKLSSIRARGLTGERFQLFDREGNFIIKDSILSKATSRDLKGVPEESPEYKRVKINHRKYHVLFSKFETENDSVFILETAASIDDVEDELDRLIFLFWLIIPAGLIITGVAAYFISKAAFKPITKMAATAKIISGENLDKRLELSKARDEVRSLAETLNAMIERIDNAFKSQKRFVANASHEIKTPLTVVRTELEILEKRIKDPESGENIQNALSEIDRLTELTNSLLTIAKMDASGSKFNLSSIRVDELLADCAQIMNSAAVKRNLQINLSIGDAVEIIGDKEKLKSVFLNLLDNAVKYSFPGTTVTIGLEAVKEGRIGIKFENTGRGIPPSDLPYIFNRFYRSDEIRAEIGGSGLGLSIAKEIIELHGGDIKVESKLGERTKFSIFLPSKVD
jgi:hypothetical protein